MISINKLTVIFKRYIQYSNIIYMNLQTIDFIKLFCYYLNNLSEFIFNNIKISLKKLERFFIVDSIYIIGYQQKYFFHISVPPPRVS